MTDMMAAAYDPDQAVASVVGSAALEGAEFSPEFVAELRRVATGEIPADSLVERIIGCLT